MKKSHLCAAALLFGVGVAPVFSEGPISTDKAIRPIDDVIHNAKRREKVLIAGTVTRSFDLDNVLLVDGKSEIAVSFVGIRQDVRPGDHIAVCGRFDGRMSYRASYGLVNALEWTPFDDPKLTDLRNRCGFVPTSAAPPASVVPPAPAAAPSVESRLRELDDLKAKNLVTPDEYREQRQRLLNQL